MARSYATVQCSIWDDEDFTALPAEAQAAYFMLVTQPDIEACGSLALTLRRWSKFVAQGDPARLVGWLNVLADARFVVIDKDTEELLVRTFAKYDGGYRHAVRVKAVVSSAEAIRSPRLRQIIAAELTRLGVTHAVRVPGAPVPPDTDPSPTRRRGASAPELVSSGSPVALSSLSTGTQEPVESLSSGSPVAVESHRSVVNVRNHQSTPHSALLGGEPDALASDPPPPTCRKHHPEGTDDPCAACGRARKARDAWDAAAPARARARQAALAAEREACPLCDPDGWRLDDAGAPTAARCSHQTKLAPAATG